jgi:xylitol oxidase
VPDELAGAVRIDGASQIIESDDDNTTQQGVAAAWSAHLPHFRIDSTPSNGDEIQTEYFVAHSDAAAALTAVRELAAEIAPHLLITELRTIAADDLWLSPAYERDSLAIHFTWKNEPDAVVAITPRIEAALEPFAPRPHWGKVNTIHKAVVASRYPRFADFRALAERVDPTGKFRGPATAELLEAGE